MELGGVHHITAVTAQAARNMAFYTQVLGLRLVKKTVNQDDVSAYHLFYADAVGSAGTDMTFFDWDQAGPHAPGAGMISASAFRVRDRGALGWWIARFDSHGVRHGEPFQRDGRLVLPFADPEGQALELVAEDGQAVIPPGQYWDKSPVRDEPAIRGVDGVTLTLARLEPTVTLLTGLLGFRQIAGDASDGQETATYAFGPGGPGAEVRLVARPDLRRGRMVGAGGVHHVAFRVPNDEEHAAWREKLASARVAVTPVIDRFYFKSIYFREPGGVLFEIATDGPGFTADEDLAHLGESLALPPFLEPHRAEIEAGLKPINMPV